MVTATKCIFLRSGNCLICILASNRTPPASDLQRATKLLHLIGKSEKRTVIKFKPFSARKKQVRLSCVNNLGIVLASSMAGSSCPNKSVRNGSPPLSAPISSMGLIPRDAFPCGRNVPLRDSGLKSYNFINSERKWILLC